MAVGDVVSNIVANGGASPHTFQPAAGVEICITQVGGNGVWSGLVSAAVPISGSNYYMINTISSDVKLMITNTNYLVQSANANYNSMYTGIQIK